MSFDSDLIRRIRDNLAQASRKEASSITLVLKDIDGTDRKNLLDILLAINKLAENPTKEAKQLSKKEQESTIVIGKLRSWINSIQQETVELRFCFPEVRRLLTAEVEADSFLRFFQDLVRLTDNLEKLKTVADFKKSEIIKKMLDLGREKKNLAQELECSISYIDRMLTFNKLCEQFPALRYAPYSYNTLLQHKKNIEKTADADPDFDAKLRTPLTPRFVAVCELTSDLRASLKTKPIRQ